MAGMCETPWGVLSMSHLIKSSKWLLESMASSYTPGIAGATLTAMFPPSQAPLPGRCWAPRVLPGTALPVCWGPGGCPADRQWGASEGCRAGLATNVA